MTNHVKSNKYISNSIYIHTILCSRLFILTFKVDVFRFLMITLISQLLI